MPGRTRKPPASPALTVLAGGAGTSPPDAPSGNARRPAPPQKPEGLSEGATHIWDELAPHCTPGTLTFGTSRVFAMLCTALATYFDADAIVQETGIVITAGQSDDLVQNPAVGIRERNDAIVAKWAKVFGLAPEPPGKAAAAPADQPRGMRHTREH